MKTNKIVKRIGIASLCLGVAVSAFSGIASFNKSISFSGKADDTTVSATDMVTATGATVTREEFTYTNTSSTVSTATGLRISSDTAYEAKFNTVFNGNSVFRFRFPETYDSTLGMYGDFKFHIADVTDPDNCFDIIYYAYNADQTRVYVQWKDQIRTTLSGIVAGLDYTNNLEDITTTNYAPFFLSEGNSSYGTRLGVMALVWNNGVLGVQQRNVSSSTAASKAARMKSLARFDGTYNPTASKKGFTGAAAMGLPKLSFPNGYTVTVSSNFTKDGVEDHGSDVVFYDVRTAATTATYVSGLNKNNCHKDCSFDGGQLYSFNNTAIEDFSSNYTKAYKTMTAQENAGKTLLGWKDANSALYPTTTALKSTDIAAYTPVYLGFDTMNGASVRIESAEGGKSGIRFMTIFDVDDYAAAKDYLTSFGTLITYTDTLNTVKKDFTIDNYTGEATFAQVKNTKSVFTYQDKNGNNYKAYSMALVDIQNFAKEYSARGYLEVTYADETTQIIYTDYNAADNSRSVAKVAYLLKTQDPTAYEAMTEARKAILDSYADAYVVPEE